MIEEQKLGGLGDSSDIKITKGPKMAHFVCDECGTEFELPEYKCKSKQTGLCEYHIVHRCPTCGDECWAE